MQLSKVSFVGLELKCYDTQDKKYIYDAINSRIQFIYEDNKAEYVQDYIICDASKF